MNGARTQVKRRSPLNQDPARLKWHRVAAGLSQAETAARAGCSAPYLSQLESGTFSASPPLLAALAEAIGCKTTDIMPDVAA